jgi:hypothetical protein
MIARAALPGGSGCSFTTEYNERQKLRTCKLAHPCDETGRLAQIREK